MHRIGQSFLDDYCTYIGVAFSLVLCEWPVFGIACEFFCLRHRSSLLPGSGFIYIYNLPVTAEIGDASEPGYSRLIL